MTKKASDKTPPSQSQTPAAGWEASKSEQPTQTAAAGGGADSEGDEQPQAVTEPTVGSDGSSPPPSPTEPGVVVLSLPFAEFDPNVRPPSHVAIDASGLKVDHRQTLLRYYLGLRRDNCTLKNGLPVRSYADAVRYWLETMSEASSTEGAA